TMPVQGAVDGNGARFQAASAPAGGAEPDVAFGAFQRGEFLTAFSLALPRAEAGDAAAQTLLGMLYSGDYGIAANPGEAAGWYRLAAASGNADAQLALGLMHLDGRGVERDR